MKQRLFVLICALGVGFSILRAQSADNVATGSVPVSLTLDDCLRIALNENPSIKVADMEIARTDYTKIETLSQLLPQASFAGTYSRTIAKQVMYMNMNFDDMLGGGGLPGLGGGSGAEGDVSDSAPQSRASSGGNSNGIKVGLDNSYQVGFSVSMPLIAPQLWAALKLTDNQILQTIESARSSRLDMVNKVKNAYYALMLAKDSKQVIKQSYDMAAFTHDLYVKQQQAGAASDYDVLRTSVAMKNIEPQLLQADVAVKQAHLQLMLLMGVSQDLNFDISGTLADYENDMYGNVLNLSRDYSQNSSLAMLDLQTNMLYQNLEVQKRSIYPTLALAFNYNWTSMSNGNPLANFRWTPYSMAALSLNLPLFTGGKRYSQIKAAEIQADEMRWNRQNLENSLQMQVDLAIDNIKVNVEQIASSAENVGQASRAHDIMKQSFEIGAASYLNLRDSELALTQSQLAYYQAIYNYLVACSGLELLQGTAPIDQYKN